MIDKTRYTVRENPNMYRDGHSKAIVNNNIADLNEHLQKKKMVKEVSENSEKISELRNDINEIKNLLKLLINNNK